MTGLPTYHHSTSTTTDQKDTPITDKCLWHLVQHPNKSGSKQQPSSRSMTKFMELLQKIQEVDQHVVIYPWLDADCRGYEPAIDNPEEIPTLLSNLKRYAYCLPIHPTGGQAYPQLFLGLWSPQTK